MSKKGLLVLAVAALAFIRVVHHGLLWSDEDYHLASALDLLHGKLPYRDFWYDKPPLNAFYYLLIGAHPGWPVRILDGFYVCAACWFAFRLATALWSEREGAIAALLLAFFLAFYLPAAVIPFAPDALLILPHLACIYFAQRRSALLCGMWCALGFLLNPKALFIVPPCLAWLFPALTFFVVGVAGPLLLAFLVAISYGMWPGYLQQVWAWGLIYARQSPETSVVANAARRTADWGGFHAALVIGSVLAFQRRFHWRLALWIVFSFAAVCVGGRFVPRYFLQVLPPLVVAGSRGIALAHDRYGRRAVVGFALLLLIPLLRFGPRYADLAFHPRPHWADAALDEDSQQIAAILTQASHPGDTLFVWGYRPDIYVYSRLTPPGLFWDSQPLTGVPADRHLFANAPVYGGPAERNRQSLTATAPTFIVDGLGPLNPNLRPERYPELRAWLQNYHLIGRTRVTLLYRRNADAPARISGIRVAPR